MRVCASRHIALSYLRIDVTVPLNNALSPAAVTREFALRDLDGYCVMVSALA